MPSMGTPEGEKPYFFRFYVNEETEYTNRMLQNIVSVLNEKMPDQYELEIVNVANKPKIAEEDSVGLTPSLHRIRPEPVERYTALHTPAYIKQALSSLGK